MSSTKDAQAARRVARQALHPRRVPDGVRRARWRSKMKDWTGLLESQSQWVQGIYLRLSTQRTEVSAPRLRCLCLDRHGAEHWRDALVVRKCLRLRGVQLGGTREECVTGGDTFAPDDSKRASMITSVRL